MPPRSPSSIKVRKSIRLTAVPHCRNDLPVDADIWQYGSTLMNKELRMIRVKALGSRPTQQWLAPWIACLAVMPCVTSAQSLEPPKAEKHPHEVKTPFGATRDDEYSATT